jgi:hypothetical protein
MVEFAAFDSEQMKFAQRAKIVVSHFILLEFMLFVLGTARGGFHGLHRRKEGELRRMWFAV